MAYTARNEADCKEFFDDPETLKKKIKKLAELVKKSKHMVAYTGAGISTSAGIADYRSGINTVLDTGAGKWAKISADAQGIKSVKKNKRRVSTMKAYPTSGHMSLVQLMNYGYLKYLISQNTDGLHRRSGIFIDKLGEIHGNSTLEICEKCKKEYMRDYICRRSLRKPKGHKDHYTGRKCTVKGCDGKLNDTIINFGEQVRFDPFALSRAHSDKSDLYICIGSSLTVAPANRLPIDHGKKWKQEIEESNEDDPVHNLCVINLQKTPLHDMGLVSLPIFAKIDDVMIGLMKELELEIPKWYLKRYIKISVRKMENKKQRMIIINGCDIDGTLFEVFKSVWMRYNGTQIDEVVDKQSLLAKRLSDLWELPELDREKGVKLLNKVFSNILNNPSDPKFRDLNFSKIRKKLDTCRPAFYLLFTAGFAQSIDGQRLQLQNNKITMKKLNDANIGLQAIIDPTQTNIIRDRNKEKSGLTEEYIYYVPKWKKSKIKSIKGKDDEKKNANDECQEYAVDDINFYKKIMGLVIELEFYKNYKEPNLMIKLNDYLNNDLLENEGEIVLKLTMDPINCKWKVPQFHNIHELPQGIGKIEIVFMKLYITSYGYDGIKAILFCGNKTLEMLPSPRKLDEYLNAYKKYNIKWIGGETGKEDMSCYTAHFHHFGLLYCYYYDYYIPQIKIQILKNICNELYEINIIDNEILIEVCEFEGMCDQMTDFLFGDWMNPYPFYKDLIISKMWSNIDLFGNELREFLNNYSVHRK